MANSEEELLTALRNRERRFSNKAFRLNVLASAKFALGDYDAGWRLRSAAHKASTIHIQSRVRADNIQAWLDAPDEEDEMAVFI